MYDLEWDGMTELGRKAAGLDVTLLDDASLMTASVAMAEAISGLEVALAHLACELDARGTCERETGLSVGSWLAQQTQLPKRRALRPLPIGRGLRDLSAIDEAVTDGRLTVEHAAHLARRCTPRVVDAVVLVQDQIIEWAADCSFEVWARQVSALIELLDEDGAHDPERDEPNSELTLADTFDGVTHLAGMFGGADAVLVRQTIDAKADELFHRTKRDRDETGGAVDIPPRQVLRAQALVELCRLANARDVGGSKAPRPDVTLIVRASGPLEGEPDDRGPDDRGPDDVDAGDASDVVEPGLGFAFAGSVRRHQGLVLPHGLDGSRGAGPRAHIPVPLLDPLRPAVSDLNGVRLRDATTRALLCDADVHALVVDSLGVPLDLGRTVRFANDDQRRVLTARDGGCVFPGCDRPPGWCDAHYVTPYEDGGLTDLRLLALLCRRHHGITHRRGWTMHATADQWFWWTAPDASSFWSQRHGHQRAGPTPAVGW